MGVPFIIWMLIGIHSLVLYQFFGTWSVQFSIHRQVGMVAKMKFPVSILPSINIISNLSSYIPMVAIVIGSLFMGGSNTVRLYIGLQFIYLLYCDGYFLFAFRIIKKK